MNESYRRSPRDEVRPGGEVRRCAYLEVEGRPVRLRHGLGEVAEDSVSVSAAVCATLGTQPLKRLGELVDVDAAVTVRVRLLHLGEREDDDKSPSLFSKSKKT